MMVGHSTGGLCAGCGNELRVDDDATRPYCTQCALDRAEEELATRSARRATIKAPDAADNARSKRRLHTTVFWLIGAVAVGVIAWSAPSVYSATLAPKPLRAGVQKTNGDADACIANLWIASGKLSVRTNPAAGLVCPATDDPYTVTRTEDLVTVACPNPADHGLDSLSVSSASLVPEVQ